MKLKLPDLLIVNDSSVDRSSCSFSSPSLQLHGHMETMPNKPLLLVVTTPSGDKRHLFPLMAFHNLPFQKNICNKRIITYFIWDLFCQCISFFFLVGLFYFCFICIFSVIICFDLFHFDWIYYYLFYFIAFSVKLYFILIGFILMYFVFWVTFQF